MQEENIPQLSSSILALEKNLPFDIVVIFVDVSAKMSQQTLDHERLKSLLARCQASGDYTALKQTLWEVFSNQESLANSWSNNSLLGLFLVLIPYIYRKKCW
ncbi:MAG: hypothetical protein FJ333_06815 [Sphingomonadales bacterium]|nr:hypothetical protein [Sphingomonadales bacterium]